MGGLADRDDASLIDNGTKEFDVLETAAGFRRRERNGVGLQPGDDLFPCWGVA
jgi:hypothetical protein